MSTAYTGNKVLVIIIRIFFDKEAHFEGKDYTCSILYNSIIREILHYRPLRSYPLDETVFIYFVTLKKTFDSRAYQFFGPWISGFVNSKIMIRYNALVQPWNSKFEFERSLKSDKILTCITESTWNSGPHNINSELEVLGYQKIAEVPK